MGLKAVISGVDVSDIVGAVLGTRLGRRCYLARLTKQPLPTGSSLDNRWLWSHWCLANDQFSPTTLARLGGLNLRAAGKWRRLLWVWLGI